MKEETVGGAGSAQERNDTANHIRHKLRPAAGGASLLCPRLRLHHATPVPRTTPRAHHVLSTRRPGRCCLARPKQQRDGDVACLS